MSPPNDRSLDEPGTSSAAPDPLAVLAALGCDAPLHVNSVVGGADTMIWSVEYPDNRFALRLFRSDQTTVVQREVAAMTAAVAGGLPVPRISASGTWQHRPALLLEWMIGRLLVQELRARPWRVWQLGLVFGRMQAAIHAVSAPTALRADALGWVEWAAPDAALRHRLLTATEPTNGLLHLDYHPMNVLVDGNQVTAVLDWANARAGDPRADLARTASILTFGPMPSGFPPAIARRVRQALIAGWRRGYREVAGPVGQMAPFYAWAGAVMARDLTPRLGRSDLPWLTAAYLAAVRRWTARWRIRAGCPE